MCPKYDGKNKRSLIQKVARYVALLEASNVVWRGGGLCVRVVFVGVLLVFLVPNSSKINLLFLFTFSWSEMRPPTRNKCNFN